ncbi:RsbR, positive regulator of sigma-B [Labilithrix luteola]|uniref:RsbR, positive regulator of sigma-B n=1 Tax=Labilithrix luteola TaxID=1391654 RepID=A0A0K1PVI0_9BACT|nr:STAS domain-containing protein [Labilithrix luteola]AKU97376.1 RsbR, positive regulator of sigma-B [Labilithrix luteola]
MTEYVDNTAEIIVNRMDDMLAVFTGIGSGEYLRLHSELPDDHALTLLYEGINTMVSSLEEAQLQRLQYQKELEEKLATIDAQRVAIRELSTPIIEVWDGILCLPVVGVLDSTRSAEMTESLLSNIVQKKASSAIIDITGIQVMDTATADNFMRLARAVSLLGARCVLTGINPAIAQTIVHMGVDLGGVVTHRSLRSALQHFITQRRAGGR